MPIETKIKRGRPRLSSPLSQKERNKRHSEKNKLKGRVQIRATFDESTIKLIKELMALNGYGKDEQSAFLTVLILEKSGKPFYAKKLKSLKGDNNEPNIEV